MSEEQTMTPSFEVNESELSQAPAVELLRHLGYVLLSPAEALRERQGRLSNVLLENILRTQLKKLNSIQYKGRGYLFSEENIQSAVERLKSVVFDGLVRTNEVVYDLLTLGTSLEQTVEGDCRSFNLNYIDWKHPERNVFHVVPEFAVERSRSTETARPDIVLFVNGIPLCVIECKSPKVELDQAISQSLRNQSEEYIPGLFVFVQLVLAVNRTSARYGTVGTEKRFWSLWRELEDSDADVTRAVADGARLVTEQDRMIHSLCRPERLLDLAYRFTVFDGGVRKVARYQQFFVIRSALRRVKEREACGRRRGGVIWHTQGSGKSLTMVMLSRCLALDPEILNPRIVLVTDRDDLDKQLGDTFRSCGLSPVQANSGRHLLELISGNRAGIVTTLVHKFDKALNVRNFVETSPDIFLLVDEAHRSQYKNMSARMRQMLPNACYIGFTGTPLMKKEKNSFEKFGAMIEPHYSIAQAVKDGAVVPLLYEGRIVQLEQNKKAIDLWFERHTQGLSVAQKADLKKKYANARMLNKTDQAVYMQAFDISEHFRENWQGTGFKAQLVAPSRAVAVQFQKYLDEIGQVTSEVVISAPDARDGYDEVDEEPSDAVVHFWKKMMARYGTEEKYNSQIINQFKNGDTPEILIVKDKLLTGFDAPRNTVLYLCRVLREHTLLQAIARVNRLFEKKDFGYVIDYANVFGELDRALGMYDAFEGFDPGDMKDTLHDVSSQVDRLPQLHSALWDVFKTVRNKKDEEAFERLLADEALRKTFYDRLRDFSKCLSIALSTRKFLEEVAADTQKRYKADCKRFTDLRRSVKLRYAETVDYRDYEPRIEKMLNTHIQANEVYRLNDPVNIFDDRAVAEVREERGVYETRPAAARADAIAHALKKTVTEKMEEDPAFYEKFSKMIQDAIDAFRAARLSDVEYLKRVSDLRDRVVLGKHEDLPAGLSGHGEAQAFYGVALPEFTSEKLSPEVAADLACALALKAEELFGTHRIVNFWDNDAAQKDVMNALDDFFFDVVKGEHGVDLPPEKMDKLIEKVMRVARSRSGR